MELLVVIVIIAVLAVLAITAYNGAMRRAAEASLQSGLRNAAGVLANDNVLAGKYPNLLIDANGGKGITNKDNVIFEYTYTSASNSYCLTARSSNPGAATYYVSSANTAPQSGACSGHGVTGNLAINGDGQQGNNTNFSSFTYDQSDSPPGYTGAFVANTGSYTIYCNEQVIPIDPAKRYVLRGWARQRTAGVTSQWYLGLCPLDESGNMINPSYYMYRPGTTTTLAQPLNTGDTIVHLANISADWYDSTLTHFRSFVFWGYTDPQGKLWPPETYTRNGWYGDIYNGGAGAINRTNNTITLNKPWPGQSYPSGHPVSNGGAGGTYMYTSASSATLGGSWQEWVSPTITGTVPSGLSAAMTAFPSATKSVKILTGINLNASSTTSRPGIGGIRFYEIQ